MTYTTTTTNEEYMQSINGLVSAINIKLGEGAIVVKDLKNGECKMVATRGGKKVERILKLKDAHMALNSMKHAVCGD